MLFLLFLLLATGGGLLLYWYINRARFQIKKQSEELYEQMLSNTSLQSDLDSLQAQVDATPTTNRLTAIGRKIAGSRVFRSTEGRDVITALDRQMEYAGRPYGWSGVEALAALILLIGGGTILVVLLYLAGGVPLWMLIGIMLSVAVVPVARIRGLKKARQQRARLELPSFINDLTMNLSSGMATIDDALARVVQTDDENIYNDRVLVREFAKAYAEYKRGGRERDEALRAVGERLGVPSVSSFIDSLLEGLRTGTPLRDTLNSQAKLAQELFRQDMRAYIGQKETTFVIGLAMIVIGLFLILGGPMMMQIIGLFSGGA